MSSRKSLQDIAFKKACENIVSVVSFITISSSPCVLVLRIVKTYGDNKWLLIEENAKNYNSRILVCLENMLFSWLRNSILYKANWEDVYEKHQYRHIRQKKLNLILFHSWYIVFKLKELISLRDHYHVYYQSHYLFELNTLKN